MSTPRRLWWRVRLWWAGLLDWIGGDDDRGWPC
jgi:hypothetical protein